MERHDGKEKFRVLINQAKNNRTKFHCRGFDLQDDESDDTLLSALSDGESAILLNVDDTLLVIGALAAVLNERFPDLFNSGKFIDQMHENLKKIRRAAEVLKRRN